MNDQTRKFYFGRSELLVCLLTLSNLKSENKKAASPIVYSSRRQYVRRLVDGEVGRRAVSVEENFVARVKVIERTSLRRFKKVATWALKLSYNRKRFTLRS